MLHASRSEVGDLLAGNLAAVERRRIDRHLLAGCEACAQLVRSLIAPERPDHEGVVRRLELSMVLAENDVAVERKQALEAWVLLKPLPPEGRLLQVRQQPELHTWGMYEKILDEAKNSVRNDPLQAVDLAHLALAVTERLDVNVYGAEKSTISRRQPMSAFRMQSVWFPICGAPSRRSAQRRSFWKKGPEILTKGSTFYRSMPR